MSSRWALLLLVIVGLTLVACSASADGSYKKIKPYKLEEVSGSEFKKVKLTQEAVVRTGIQVVPAGELTVPYASIVYGNHGEEWVYTNPEPTLFIREEVVVDRIEGTTEGGTAYLLEGPAPGTLVVTAGAAELWGTEFGVGK
ncbi:MAG: hypothetical protein ACE5Q6_11220 [Dehalococcoidia bacterium]